MRLRIPKSITIFGRKFSVKNSLSDEQMKKLMGDNTCPMGAMNYSLRQVLIREHQDKEEQMITFFHEATHIMMVHSGLNQVISGELQEVICESNANMIHDLLKSMK